MPDEQAQYDADVTPEQIAAAARALRAVAEGKDRADQAADLGAGVGGVTGTAVGAVLGGAIGGPVGAAIGTAVGGWGGRYLGRLLGGAIVEDDGRTVHLDPDEYPLIELPVFGRFRFWDRRGWWYPVDMALVTRGARTPEEATRALMSRWPYHMPPDLAASLGRAATTMRRDGLFVIPTRELLRLAIVALTPRPTGVTVDGRRVEGTRAVYEVARGGDPNTFEGFVEGGYWRAWPDPRKHAGLYFDLLARFGAVAMRYPQAMAALAAAISRAWQDKDFARVWRLIHLRGEWRPPARKKRAKGKALAIAGLALPFVLGRIFR